MRLSKSDEKKYPALHKYLKSRLSRVWNVPKISNALKLHGEFTDKTLQDALSYGASKPVIQVSFLPGYCGAYKRKSAPDIIMIDKRLVDRMTKTPNRGNIFQVGATILHELTHWGDNQDGIQQTNAFGLVEEGNEFEMSAYGSVIPCVL